jgi:hypothetical protein
MNKVFMRNIIGDECQEVVAAKVTLHLPGVVAGLVPAIPKKFRNGADDCKRTPGRVAIGARNVIYRRAKMRMSSPATAMPAP